MTDEEINIKIRNFIITHILIHDAWQKGYFTNQDTVAEDFMKYLDALKRGKNNEESI